MEPTIINVKDVKRTFITKKGTFKKTKVHVEAVKGISFEVKKGEIFGLLGPNGAGKTTTIKMLTTMLVPSSGEITILGENVEKNYKSIRSKINFILGGERNLYRRLTAYDNLAYFADLYKIPRTEQHHLIMSLLQLVELEEVKDRMVETYSKGMKQRLQIARGLLNNPEVLFLDEPSIGLDPVSARKLRAILKKLNDQGTTILLTTHYMYEADELCDRIAFINQGEIVMIDTPSAIKNRLGGSSTIHCSLVGILKETLHETLKNEAYEQLAIEEIDGLLKCTIQTKTPQRIIATLYELTNVQVVDVAITQTSLEDAYIELIGGEGA